MFRMVYVYHVCSVHLNEMITLRKCFFLIVYHLLAMYLKNKMPPIRIDAKIDVFHLKSLDELPYLGKRINLFCWFLSQLENVSCFSVKICLLGCANRSIDAWVVPQWLFNAAKPVFNWYINFQHLKMLTGIRSINWTYFTFIALARIFTFAWVMYYLLMDDKYISSL